MERKDGLLYYLTALNLSDKEVAYGLPSTLQKWKEHPPLIAISLLSPRIFNTFVQLYLIKNLRKLKDDLLIALIPIFINYLNFPTNVCCPVTEMLLEKAAQTPLTFGRALFYTIKSLHPMVRERAVFSLMLENLLSLCPMLRDFVCQEVQITKHIKQYIDQESFNVEKVCLKMIILLSILVFD